MGLPITAESIDDLSKDIATIDEVVESTNLTAITKSGKTINTLQGQLTTLGYEAPIAYAGSIVFAVEDTTKTVEEVNVLYAPRISALPFTTSGTFIGDDDARFYVILDPTRILFRDTLAALLADITILENQTFDILGRVAAGDGGDMRFSIVPAATGTEDLVEFFDHDTLPLQLQSRFPMGWVNVKHGGADGITNDKAAIEACSNFLAARPNGGELIVENITLKINSNTGIDPKVKLVFKKGGKADLVGNLILNGSLEDTMEHIFIDNGGLVVLPRNGKVGFLRPEMFGAVADHAVNGLSAVQSGAALQSCITACLTGRKKMELVNGGYRADLVNLVIGDVITVDGHNREHSYLIWTSACVLTGTALEYQQITSGSIDTEEAVFKFWSVRIECATFDYGFRGDSSYFSAYGFMTKTNSTQAIALWSLNPILNTNQIRLIDCHVRSQVPLNGTGVGLWIQRGANIGIYGGYFGGINSPIKVGNAVERVSQLDISGGTIIETFVGNSATTQGIEVISCQSFTVAARIQYAGVGQRAIRIEGDWIAGGIERCDFDSTGSGAPPISFNGESSDVPAGLRIGNNNYRGGLPNVIELINRTTAFLITGITQANPAVVTTSAAHGFANETLVQPFDVGGMTEVNDIRFIIANVNATTFELKSIDSTGFGAYTTGGEVAKMATPSLEIGQNSFAATGNKPLLNIVFAKGDNTPDVSSSDRWLFNNSAATDITDFDGMEREERVTKTFRSLLGNEILKFSTSGAIKRKGGITTDYPVAANEILEMEHEDEVWFFKNI